MHVLLSGYKVPEHPGNLYYNVRWRVKEGLNIGLLNEESGKAILITIDGKKAIVGGDLQKEQARLVRGSFQRHLVSLPTADRDSVELTIKFRPETWRVYLDNRPVCSFRPPFSMPVTVTQVEGDLPEKGESEPFFQKVGDFVFRDNFLAEAEAENRLGEWHIESGQWNLHSVLDSLEEWDEALRKRGDLPPQAQYSPNFYSLKGFGDSALITSGHDFYDSYSIEAAMQTAASEMGVVFLVEGPNRYYSFTLDMRDDSHSAVLRLKRHAGDDMPPVTIAAARAGLTYDQWVNLRAVVGQDRIRCFLDDSQVFDIREQLPAGGRFGLYAQSLGGVRFDDVAVATHKDPDLRTMSDLKRCIVTDKGRLVSWDKGLRQRDADNEPVLLSPPVMNEGQELVVGAVSHQPHVFSARFKPEATNSVAGLLVGYRGGNEPYYRFTSKQSPEEVLVSLEKLEAGTSEIVETRRYAPENQANEPFTLMADACSGGGLRLYRNSKLVIVRPEFATVTGASGLYVAAKSDFEISDLSYRFERDDINRNQFEKNETFVKDPYMRHWSSPEGEWITGKDELTWYKGDFFGRFSVRFPFCESSEVHLGVSEESTTGSVRLSVDDETVRMFDGRHPETPAEPVVILNKDLLSKVQAESSSVTCYTVHHEDSWIWLTSGDELLFKHRLSEGLAGRRMRAAGFDESDLKYTRVDRYRVKDYLFTHSLHNWTINGGAWEVVNRFECQPRWSHMIGQSRDTIAALWAKYLFEGDFCVEMYAGMRHGWYERPGDLNMTVFNDTTSPSSGYTVTCAGWDKNHSQLYTKLFRNGQEILQSDRYTVPRVRDGSQRRGHNPLVPGGRDVHGAWYFIKFRKIGNTLEYYFDNELVFSTEDPDALSSGSLGIWTFMNSMVVARVKIAAEKISIKPTQFERLDVPVTETSEAQAYGNPWNRLTLLQGYRPWFWTWPGNWIVDDGVGRGTITWKRDQQGLQYFVTKNTLGSGTMFTRCKTNPSILKHVAGWRFYMKRTPKALVNFHFSVGNGRTADVFEPSHSFFSHISGEDSSESKLMMVGSADVPATEGGDDWVTKGDWVPVEIWLPPVVYATGAKHVRVEGFGNMQPGDVIQGLIGNAPGEGYAVKGFSEIRFNAPGFSFPSDAPDVKKITLRDAAGNQPLFSCKNMKEFNQLMKTFDRTGHIQALLEIESESLSARREVSWVDLPEQPSLTCLWHNERPGQLVIGREGDFPDPRTVAESVLVNGAEVEVLKESINSTVATLPVDFSFGTGGTNQASVLLRTSESEYDFVMKRQDSMPNDTPVLVGIEGLTPFLRNFEYASPAEKWKARRLSPWGQRINHLRGHPERGGYFEVINRGRQERLMVEFGVSFSLAKYPVLQMRYCGDSMANVSIALDNRRIARFSEKNSPGRHVRGIETIEMNDKWQTWRGLMSDVMIGLEEEKVTMFADKIEIGSQSHNKDQTGIFSRLLLDDLVLGPAVSDSSQLTFTPRFRDFDGVAAVEVAVCSKPDNISQVSCPGEPVWQEFAPGEAITPEISSLPDGFFRILVRAKDNRGGYSDVTEIPALLDRDAVEVSCEMIETEAIKDNGTLLQFSMVTGQGAPVDVDNLRMEFRGKPFEVHAEHEQHMIVKKGRTELSINWPLIFKDSIDQMKDGDVAEVVLSGIADGAGNESSPFSTSVKLDYAADKMPPTLLQTAYPDNVLWASNWDDSRISEAGIKDPESPYTDVSIVKDVNEGAYCKIELSKGRGRVKKKFSSREWMVEAFPYVGFRVRRKALESEGNAYFAMHLYLSNGHKLYYKLGWVSAEQADDHPEKVDGVDVAAWPSEEWVPVVLDLRELKMRNRESNRGVASADLKHAWVSTIRFEAVADEKESQEVHLQNVSVFSTWGEEDNVVMNAYDASGIEEYVSRIDPVEANKSTSPVKLPAGHDPIGWVTMQARDKAGNLSPPVRFPRVGYLEQVLPAIIKTESPGQETNQPAVQVEQ